MIVDFHSHILPGMDDGSRSAEESLAMLRMEAEQGISHVVATPHFYGHRDSIEEFLQRRQRAEDRLRQQMEGERELPEVAVGAEVFYYSGISESESLEKLTIGGTRFVLIEMPFGKWTEKMFRELEQIHSRQSLVPIIAHVDRYINPWRTGGIPARLETLPVMVQANAAFFLNKSTGAMALRMLKKEQIHLLGSDCHNLTARKPNLGMAVEKILKKQGQEAILRIRDHQREVFPEW